MKDYLTSVIKQFEYYKMLGEKTFDQLSDKELFDVLVSDGNSVATIVKHLHGNMLSRWTNFMTEDGEKEWRNRDGEFEVDFTTRQQLIDKWSMGWQCLFDAIRPLTIDDLYQLIYIRNMGHTVVEAINRQLAHYAYHVGQIVFIGKLMRGDEWQSLSIPKGKSVVYNDEKFAKPKRKEHFTDDL